MLLLVSFVHTSDQVLLDMQDSAQPLHKESEKIAINFVGTDITEIITEFAGKLNVNVILPTGANELKVKVDFVLPHKITIDEAWSFLQTLLDMSGYSLLPKGDMYIIIKNGKDVFDIKNSRQPTRLFVNTDINKLAETDERITYIYYFSNLKIADENNNQVLAAAKAFFPDQSFYKFDKTYNSMIITTKSSDIKAFVELIIHIDKNDYMEHMEFIPLNYTAAQQVADIFNKGLIKSAQPQSPIVRYRNDRKDSEEESYFSKTIKIIAYNQKNSLIAMGRKQAIDRVKNFIYKYIDIPLESGRSVLHSYKLQYLNAKETVKTLNEIVSATSGKTSGQSIGGQKSGSVERVFSNPVIIPDKADVQSGGNGNGKYNGTNTLLIASTNDDWERLKFIIQKMDLPPREVVVEILVADLTLEDTRQIANQIRNPEGIPLSQNVSAQAAHLIPPVIAQDTVCAANQAGTLADGATLAPDLIETSLKNATQGGDIGVNDLSAALNAPAGTTVLQISDSDGKTWDILTVLSALVSNKIIYHTHVVIRDNGEATVAGGEIRLVDDAADPAVAGIKVGRSEIPANFAITIKPRISFDGTEAMFGSVILDININIDVFDQPFNSGVTSANRITRTVQTSAYIKSGEVLALGGLVQTGLNDVSTNTPILSRIPLIGNLFRRRRSVQDQTALSVFIVPTVIQPKARQKVDEYTKVYADLIKNASLQDDLFYGLKDPVTRWFFNNDLKDANETVEDFLEEQKFIAKENIEDRIEKVSFVSDSAESVNDWALDPEEDTNFDFVDQESDDSSLEEKIDAEAIEMYQFDQPEDFQDEQQEDYLNNDQDKLEEALSEEDIESVANDLISNHEEVEDLSNYFLPLAESSDLKTIKNNVRQKRRRRVKKVQALLKDIPSPTA